jgi:hypothetical protein
VRDDDETHIPTNQLRFGGFRKPLPSPIHRTNPNASTCVFVCLSSKQKLAIAEWGRSNLPLNNQMFIVIQQESRVFTGRRTTTIAIVFNPATKAYNKNNTKSRKEALRSNYITCESVESDEHPRGAKPTDNAHPRQNNRAGGSDGSEPSQHTITNIQHIPVAIRARHK